MVRNLGLVVLLALVCVVYIYVCPYNKVEESFNTQAIHDLLFHGTDLNAYDHLEFPGVVPRSFIGPLLIAIHSYPWKLIMTALDLPKLYVHYYIRAMLGFLNLVALYLYIESIARIFGNNTAKWTLIVTLCQFHYLFYISRTLPNSFALFLSQIALSGWFSGNSALFIVASAVGILVFRSELAILLGMLLLYSLYSGITSFKTAVKWSLVGGVLALSCTLPVDSFFWRRWLWPEGEVLWYNAVLNKSSQWGTSPFLWYFYSALPRMLLCALPLSMIGNRFDRRIMGLVVPPSLFVLIYSFLPHKELRFILYVIPLFNTAAGRAIDCIQQMKGVTGKICKAFSYASLVLSLVISWMLLYVSHHNYPGGVGFSRTHELENGTYGYNVSVHISVEAAQTGVSRFGELNQDWLYSKREEKDDDSDFMQHFTWIISTEKKYEKYHAETHELVEKVVGYDGISWNKKQLLPIPKIELKTKLVIAKWRKGIQCQG